MTKFGGQARAFDQIDNAPEEKARGIRAFKVEDWSDFTEVVKGD